MSNFTDPDASEAVIDDLESAEDEEEEMNLNSDVLSRLNPTFSTGSSGSGNEFESGSSSASSTFDNKGGVTAPAPPQEHFLAGWFGQTKAQKKAQQEFEKFQKQFTHMNSGKCLPTTDPLRPSPSFLLCSKLALYLCTLLVISVNL